jgi:hypothetical protein
MESLKKHDSVFLENEKFIVGLGTVQKVLPDDVLRGTRLGDDRVAVLIEDVFDSDDDIPYPSGNVVKLSDAKDFVVLWDRANTKLFTQQTSPNTIGREFSQNVPDSQGDANAQLPNSQRVEEDIGVDETNEEDSLEQVCLYIGTKVVAHGIVCDKVHHKHLSQEELLEGGLLHVKVTEVFEQDESYPFPSKECNTIGEAIHLNCIIWKAAFVVHVKDPIATHGDPKPFSVGDDIHLQINGISVAHGEVFQTHPLDKVHNILLGFNRVSIYVRKSFHDSTKLPYPSAGASTIGEAVGSYVIWNTSDVCKVEAPFHDEVDDDIGLNSSTKACEDDFTDRSKWHLKDVEIFNGMDRTTILATGSITTWSPLASINNEEVGDDHVGVLVQNLVCDEVIRQQLFPTFVEGYPCLVKWPILSLKLVICDQFLADILATKQDDNEDDNANDNNNESVDIPSRLLLLEYEQPKKDTTLCTGRGKLRIQMHNKREGLRSG